MQQITYINKEDLDSLELNEDGTYKVPDNFIIYLNDNRQEIENLQNEIARIEALTEPTDAELIKWAKQEHPYYMDLMMAEHYKLELIKYKE